MPITRLSRSASTGGKNPYGTVPQLPSSQALQGNINNILNTAIPGYSGLSQSASSIIGSALSGQVPSDVQDLIRTNAATQAVRSGMPGSSAQRGTLMGNRVLRDLGLTSLQRQDAGLRDLTSMLQGVSGAAAPTYGQLQEQENAAATYAAAPDPGAAAAEQERLFNKYSDTQFGRSSSPRDELPWYYSPAARQAVKSGGWYSIDPFTGQPQRARL